MLSIVTVMLLALTLAAVPKLHLYTCPVLLCTVRSVIFLTWNVLPSAKAAQIVTLPAAVGPNVEKSLLDPVVLVLSILSVCVT